MRAKVRDALSKSIRSSSMPEFTSAEKASITSRLAA